MDCCAPSRGAASRPNRGIDGAGTTTELPYLTAHIKELSKYNDVLETHEPWKSDEIKRRLAEDPDAFSGGLEMSRLYVEDRVEHTRRLVMPNLKEDVFVLSDRYSMSTCAYQWAQGVKLDHLLDLHRNRVLNDMILKPDITFYLDVSSEVAAERIGKRGESQEKFEQDKFRKVLIEKYRSLVEGFSANEDIFGKVVRINGELPIEEVALDIKHCFNEFYDSWTHQNA